MRANANSDQAFWSKPADGGTGWMDDAAADPMDAAESQALDDLARGRHEPTDRIFHELRDVTPMAPVAGEARADTPIDGLGDGVSPDRATPTAASAPAASTPAFDIDAVSDDLLPTWNLDLD